MRVLAVGQLEHLLERADHERREILPLLLEPAGDRGVVPGGVGERLGGEALPRRRGEAAFGLAELVEHGVVAGGAHDRGGEGAVLGSGPDHRRAADVDVLDDLVVGDAARGGGPLKRIQVHAHEIDELDLLLLGGDEVLRVVADGKQAGVELGMKRLDPAVHDLREAGEITNRTDTDAGVLQLASGAARGDDLDPEIGEAAGELADAGLVRDRQQRARDLDLARGDGGNR